MYFDNKVFTSRVSIPKSLWNWHKRVKAWNGLDDPVMGFDGIIQDHTKKGNHMKQLMKITDKFISSSEDDRIWWKVESVNWYCSKDKTTHCRKHVGYLHEAKTVVFATLPPLSTEPNSHLCSSTCPCHTHKYVYQRFACIMYICVDFCMLGTLYFSCML